LLALLNEIVAVIDNSDKSNADYDDDILVLDKVLNCEIGFANIDENGNYQGYVPYGQHALEISGNTPIDIAYDALYTSYTADDGDSYSNVIDDALQAVTDYYHKRGIELDDVDPYDHFWVYPEQPVGKKKTNFKWLKLCIQFITVTINKDKPSILNIEHVYMLYNHSMNMFDEPEVANPFHVEIIEYDLTKAKPRGLSIWDVYIGIDNNLTSIMNFFNQVPNSDNLISKIKNRELRARLKKRLKEQF
jgi:hypothetical protein